MDFDHEAALRHTYSKFGFAIKDYRDYRALRLDLFDEPTPRVTKDGFVACCRDSGYHILRGEEILAAEERRRQEAEKNAENAGG